MNNHIEQIKSKVAELQRNLGVKLQVTIYSEGAKNAKGYVIKTIQDIAKICRMSEIEVDGANYAVKIIAEGLGEIPFALSAIEVYEVGEER